jgi:hypothetical protein
MIPWSMERSRPGQCKWMVVDASRRKDDSRADCGCPFYHFGFYAKELITYAQCMDWWKNHQSVDWLACVG